MVTRSAWLGASLLALAILCTVDLLWPAHRVSATFLGALTALGVALALLHGVCLSLAWWLVRRLHPTLRLLFWPALSLAAGVWLAHDLGAFVRLHSRYWLLATYVLVACGLAGVLFGLLCACFQPSVRSPIGFILEQRLAKQRALACLLIAVTAGLAIADRRAFPNQYPDAHAALRLAAFWCLTMALVTLDWTLGSMTRLRWLAVFAGYGICLLTLDERRVAVLDAFGTHAWPAGVLAANRTLWDWDRDGYASVLGAGDCAPWNPRIHPGAREIPGNGIDDNCVFGDGKLRLENIEMPALAKEPPPVDVVLITVDALNRGHLGVYNPAYYGPRGRATSPNLDRWAEHATVFDHAYTPGGWTSIAVPSLMRGIYPRRLEWRKYFETTRFALVPKAFGSHLRPGETPMLMFPLAFDDPHPALAELLRRRGMHCMAVVDDGYSSMLQPGTGLSRGFDVFRQTDRLPEPIRNDEGTANIAIELLAKQPAQGHFFLWVHFFGTHWPSETHAGVRRYGDSVVDEYDHEVLFLDGQLARLLAAIEARPSPTAVFVTADHGEGFSPGGRTHGQVIDEAVLNIPLLARVPGWPTGHITKLAGSIDLVPTILAVTKTPAPSNLDGVDLAALLNPQYVPSRFLFSDTWRFGGDEKLELDYTTAYDGTRQFILNQLTGSLYLADQTQPMATPRVVARTPKDPLAAAVYSYIEDTGGLHALDE
jgi:arylsulfatase A-like enzyme